MMRKIIIDILTGIDNQTFDHGRVLGLGSFLFYYVLAFASLLEGHPWSPLDFASGIGAMAVGFGVHLKLKKETEPSEKT
jgi:hypothetical protein